MVIILFIAPVSASAVSLGDLNIQIAELLARVFNLKAQLARVGTIATTTLSVPVPASDLSCLILNRDIAYGDKGYDVTQMQLFLARNTYIYPEASITGYFGRSTQRAVQRFQVSRGIVAYGTPSTTGYGVVGPKTRAEMRKSCPPPEVVEVDTATSTDSDVLIKELEAAPTAGGTPFNSMVSFTLSDKCVSYYLDWGDDTMPLSIDSRDVACDGVEKEVKVNHVYPRNGVYTAVLRAGKDPTTNQLKLTLPVVSYKAIVAGSAVQPFSLTPTSGPAPLSVTASFTLTNPACTSYLIDWGDGKKDSFEPTSFACSKNITTRRITHIYNDSGTYDVTLRKGQSKVADLPIAEQWLVDVSELDKGKTVIKLTDTAGIAPLRVQVKLATANGYCTSYDIDWGDGTSIQRKEYVAPENSEFSVDDFVVADSADFVGATDDCYGSFERTFTHTYVMYGAYPLRIKLGKGLLKDIDTVQHWVSVFSR